jgi:lambda family phage portal protein
MKKFLKRLWNAIFNRYEAASQSWSDRSWLNTATQDARFDANEATRRELVRRSRYWEQNNFIVNRLADLFEQFTVGANGLQVIPASNTETWNTSASEWWGTWCRFPALDCKQPFGILQSVMARAWFVDGEVFIWKTFSENQKISPRIQLIEAHRVQTPPDMREQEGKTIIDGVKVDGNGRPIGYYVKIGFKDNEYQLVSADQMIHLFEPSRPGMYRGIPFLSPVMNMLHDLDDLQMFEMRAAKEASAVTNVITNASGEIKDAATLRKVNMNTTTQGGGPNGTTKPDPQYYQTLLGARTIALKKGEDMKQFAIDRPSVVSREYWDYLLAAICAGVGISRLLVLPFSMQGTVTRADLDVSAVFFRSRSQVISAAIREVYVWVMTFAAKYDKALDGAPDDFLKHIIRPPRSVNVDVGRNSSAVIAELDSGTRTYQDIYAEKGEDWREQLTQKAKERAFVHALAKEYSTPEEKVSIDEIAATAAAPVTPDPQERSSSDSIAATSTPP